MATPGWNQYNLNFRPQKGYVVSLESSDYRDFIKIAPRVLRNNVKMTFFLLPTLPGGNIYIFVIV